MKDQCETETLVFTPQEIENWRAYERIRSRGKWNMLHPGARKATKLSPEEYSFVMRNFTELRAAAEGKDQP